MERIRCSMSIMISAITRGRPYFGFSRRHSLRSPANSAASAGPETQNLLGIRLEVEQLARKYFLPHEATDNWAAALSASRIRYSDYASRNSDPGKVLEVRPCFGTGFLRFWV